MNTGAEFRRSWKKSFHWSAKIKPHNLMNILLLNFISSLSEKYKHMSLTMENAIIVILSIEASTRERIIYDSRPGNTINGKILEENKVTHIT